MSRTIPQEAFSPDGLRRHVAESDRGFASHAADADARPLLQRPSLADQLRKHGRASKRASGQRFEIEGVLGLGATGQVYSVLDHNLERPVAVKFLGASAGDDEIDGFIDEAQITASLQHPNVLPVHELDVNDAGQIYFSMKQIDGRSLGAAIDQSAHGNRAPAIASPNAVVSIVIDVCQALAYAHHRGIVHQDVKPDNVMLGDFGEVLLVDWGSAARLTPGSRPRLYGTPLYMSPEQARLERVDERSDIYCLGATLFHALTLRCPTWSDDPDAFWRMKREGTIQPPTIEERAAIPAALLAIAVKALSADASHRYASADALVQDLTRYQEGLAVSAHRDSLIEALARWHRRHARALWPTVVAAIVVLSLAASLYGERLKEMAAWGRPLVDETFSDGHWGGGWIPIAGEFEVRDGRLVSTNGFASILLYQKKLSGAIAVEYDAEILPGSHLCDISLMWSREVKPRSDGSGGLAMVDPYKLQVGAFDGSYSAIMKGDSQHLAYNAFCPLAGRVYRVRAEIEDNRMTLSVDGKVLCEHLDPLPFTSGFIALYGYYKGKAFDNVRIYGRGTPQKVPATAVGDAYARTEQYDRAIEEYLRVSEDHPDTALGREARYRAGLCRWWQKEPERAFALWAPLDGTDHEELVRVHRLDDLFMHGQHDRLLGELPGLYRSATAPTRKLIAMRWAEHVFTLRSRGDKPALERYLAAHDALFPDQTFVDINAAACLLELRRFEEVLSRYPRQRLACTMALRELGREDEIVRDYPDQRRQFDMAAISTGQSSLIDQSEHTTQVGMGLWKRGHPEEALERFPEDLGVITPALCLLGRLDEVPLRAPTDLVGRARALCLAGRANEVLDPRVRPMVLLAQGLAEDVIAETGPGIVYHAWARRLIGLRAWIAGDHRLARAWFAPVANEDLNPYPLYFLTSFVIPFIEGLDRDAAALTKRCEFIRDHRRYMHEQRSWYDASYLLGAIDDDGYMKQEHCVFADADLDLCRGMRLEREHRSAEAASSYRAYLAMPLWRRGHEVDPVLTLFAEWRLRESTSAR